MDGPTAGDGKAASRSKRKRDSAGETAAVLAPHAAAEVVRVGSLDLRLGANLVEMADSTADYMAGRWSALRARLDADGFLLVRGVIPRAAVQAARAAVLQHLGEKGALREGAPVDAALAEYARVHEGARSKSKLISGWVVYAETGEVVDDREPDAATAGWRQVGSSAALTGIYNGAALHAFYEQLFGDTAQVGQGSNAGELHLAAAAGPNASPAIAAYTALPACTWLRAKGPSEVTMAHVDYFYFYRHTHVYRDHWPIAAAPSAGTPPRPACEVCRALGGEGSPLPLCCALCGLAYHAACLVPQLRRRVPAGEDWHCHGCTNLPMPHYTCWLPLGDLTAEDGRLALVPGSHRSVGGYEAEAVRDHLPSGWTRDAARAAVWQTPRAIGMGDLIIFNAKTVHAATQNHAQRLRLSIDTRVTTGARRR